MRALLLLLLALPAPVTMKDPAYGIQRRVWIAKSPATLDTSKGDYNLFVLLPGELYATEIGAASAVDSLVKAGKIGPTVTVMIDTNDLRPASLAASAKWDGFIADSFMPWLRKELGTLPKTSRITIGGWSIGGVTAAYLGFRHPELFGNVLAQSGAFWRDNVTEQLRKSPRLPLRFYIEVGAAETQVTPNGVAFIDANRHFRDALKAKGYTFEYVEVPAAKHEPGHWRAALPAGLSYLAH